jgi:hypothetical protein
MKFSTLLFLMLFAFFSCREKAVTEEEIQTDLPAAAQDKTVTRISVPEREFKYGDVNRGETAAHTFVIKNISTEVLHIKRAQGS